MGAPRTQAEPIRRALHYASRSRETHVPVRSLGLRAAGPVSPRGACPSGPHPAWGFRVTPTARPSTLFLGPEPLSRACARGLHSWDVLSLLRPCLFLMKLKSFFQLQFTIITVFRHCLKCLNMAGIWLPPASSGGATGQVSSPCEAVQTTWNQVGKQRTPRTA